MIWAAAAEFKVLYMRLNTQTYLSMWEILFICSEVQHVCFLNSDNQ